jgi:hypothetical protein
MVNEEQQEMSPICGNSRTAPKPAVAETLCALGSYLANACTATDGITAKVFGILNELAVESVRSGKEQITDEDVENWKAALTREAVFA